MTKRYTTPEQILAEIDKARAEAQRMLKLADSLEQEAKRLMLIPNLEEDGKYKLKESTRYRSKAHSLSEYRVKHLRAKIAEVLTPTIPGLGIEDQSVSAKLL